MAGSERVILRVPKAKISGSPSGFAGGPTDSGPGHVGGAGLDFDSAGNLYLGVGDDVSPNASGHNGYPPQDFRAQERWDARKTSANSADLRGKVVRITPLQGDIPSDATPGVGATYTVPAGNLFAPGTPKTRPEIYAMGFRQPFTLHTDPKNPGIVGVGEYCHDNSANQANRAPAGTCEWNLIAAPGNFGWPFCVGNNSTANTTFRWNYATNATGPQYDCSLASMPSDIRYAPSGQTAVEPTNDGLDTLPGPAVPATVWKKYTGDGSGTAAGLRRPQRRRHAADGRPDLPLRRGDGQPGRLPALLRRLVDHQQPRRRQWLLEGSPHAQGQQPDAARQRLVALQLRRHVGRAELEPRDRLAVRS